MKKFILLSITLLVLTVVTAQEKKFLSYYSISGGLSSLNDKTLSLEVGCWGVEKPVMYSASVDWVNQDALYVALKPYYQLTYAKNYYLFTYFAPKFNIRNPNDFLLEVGVMNYTKVSKYIYTSYGIGFQSAKTYNIVLSINFGLNLVL